MTLIRTSLFLPALTGQDYSGDIKIDPLYGARSIWTFVVRVFPQRLGPLRLRLIATSLAFHSEYPAISGW